MSESADREPEEGGGIALGDILRALRRRFWMIALFVVAAAGVVVTLILTLPNMYEGIAAVQIDPRKKTIVAVDAVIPDIQGDTPTIESQVEILKSKLIALKVIDALGLRTDPEFTGLPASQKISVSADESRRRLEVADATRSVMGPGVDEVGTSSPERDDIAAVFADRLKVTRIRNTLVVEIAFRSRDPVKAARIANTIAEVYIRDQIEIKVKASSLAAELVAPKIASLRAKISEAETKIARYKAENGLVDADGKALSEIQLARLTEQSVQVHQATAEARARYEQLRALRAGDVRGDIGDVLQSSSVKSLKDLLAKAKKREAELLTRYGDRHPEIARVRAEIADLTNQIQRETDQAVTNAKDEYRIALDREKQIEANLVQLKQQESVSKEVSVKLRDLEREAESSRRLYETMLARHKQIVESQDLVLPDSRIVERADVPGFPVWPKRKQLAIIGMLAGFGLGIGLSLVLELTQSGMRRRDEAEAIAGAPLLASIPRLERSGDGPADPMRALRVVLAEPQGAFTDAIHELATRLEEGRSEAGSRVVLFTSSLPNEGTTVTASNLALAVAARGARVLLVDGDLRRSKLTQRLGLDTAPGLADAIGQGQDFESVLLSDTVSGLAVMPAGDAGRFPMTPQEALAAPGFAQRLSRLKAHFDFIAIDAPPLLPVVDARILASYVDEIVLVTNWRSTPKDITRKAIRLLGSNAQMLSGMVFNRVDAKAVAKLKRRPAARARVRRRAA
ncbi:MAG: AAA family ATPase [Proteobacteria bacterium]|nr:AAA family ATPase [Pseudomonadota bacterium]